MHTELFCTSLEKLDHISAIRAIHQALLQLDAHAKGVENLDDRPAREALRKQLVAAGHIGFVDVATAVPV